MFIFSQCHANALASFRHKSICCGHNKYRLQCPEVLLKTSGFVATNTAADWPTLHFAFFFDPTNTDGSCLDIQWCPVNNRWKAAVPCKIFKVDDSQIYLPLKRNDKSSLIPLLECPKDVKAWMAFNFLNLNEEKTEVMVFGPSWACGVSSIDLGSMQPNVKPIVTNLAVKMDSDFKLDKQINSIVKSLKW